MRPRLITAENVVPSGWPAELLIRFNEAAAHHRGERTAGAGDGRRRPASMRPHHRGERRRTRHGPREQGASMRPRLITAENKKDTVAKALYSSLQ